ncbi:hypothetical protein D3C71_1374940 [compost metagenome]
MTGAAVGRIGRQYFAKRRLRTAAVFAELMRAQCLFAGAIQCQQAPRGGDALLQLTLGLALCRQRHGDTDTLGRLCQCLSLVLRLRQQRRGLRPQLLAGLFQAALGGAVLRLLGQYRQIQRDCVVGFLIKPPFG